MHDPAFNHTFIVNFESYLCDLELLLARKVANLMSDLMESTIFIEFEIQTDFDMFIRGRPRTPIYSAPV